MKESQQFLDAIGSAEMEARNTEESDKISKRTKALMEDETGISTSVDDEDIKRYLDEVLIELKGIKDHRNH